MQVPLSNHVIVTRPNPQVAWLKLNRPEQLNAMTAAMGDDLMQQLAILAKDDQVRVVVLTGQGRAFSAGGDLDFLEANSQKTPELIEQEMRAFYGRFLKILDFPKPMIAAINGAAVGAGLCIAMACDLRIATMEAKMGVNFAKIGISPGMATTYLLPRLVGVANAMDLLLTGRLVLGSEAHSLGLVHRLTSAVELEQVTQTWAEEIAQNAPIALRLIKRFVYQGLDSRLDDVLAREAFGQSITFASQDLREGVAAVRQKRKAHFRGC